MAVPASDEHGSPKATTAQEIVVMGGYLFVTVTGTLIGLLLALLALVQMPSCTPHGSMRDTLFTG
jgi:hypothetical protein